MLDPTRILSIQSHVVSGYVGALWPEVEAEGWSGARRGEERISEDQKMTSSDNR